MSHYNEFEQAIGESVKRVQQMVEHAERAQAIIDQDLFDADHAIKGQSVFREYMRIEDLV